jgi:deoxyribonucleoside regulator
MTWRGDSAVEVAALRRSGAVGDVCTRPFGVDGAAVAGVLDNRIMAVQLDALRRVRTVIAVAGGAETAEAILGAVAGGLVNVLVTDHIAARAILGREGRPDTTAIPRRATGRR